MILPVVYPTTLRNGPHYRKGNSQPMLEPDCFSTICSVYFNSGQEDAIE
jgi:hypothetical protein